jgi:PilZ domain
MVDMSPQGIRKYPRFVLRQPAAVVIRESGELRRLPAVTENMSRGGALFTTASSIPEGTKVELTVFFQRTMNPEPLEVHCTGQVLRIEPRPATNGYAMAVEFEPPLPPSIPGKLLH